VSRRDDGTMLNRAQDWFSYVSTTAEVSRFARGIAICAMQNTLCSNDSA